MNLGRTLGLQVVAEGVEEPGQRVPALDRMRSAQGYLFSKPVDAGALEGLLSSGRDEGASLFVGSMDGATPSIVEVPG